MIISKRVIVHKFRSKFDISIKSANAATHLIKDKMFGTSSSALELVRPFTEMPGPKALPLIGNIFRFIPGIGEYGGMTEQKVLDRLRADYGNIVRLEGLLNRRACVCLFDADLCERLYRLEGPWPMRISMESLHRYFILNSNKRTAGFFNSQGEEWHELRSHVNQPMMQPRIVSQYVQQIDEVARDFVDKMREMRDPGTLEMPTNFNNELNKWALESLCLIALDQRLGCFEPNLLPDSDPQRMILAANELFVLVQELEYMPSLWKYYNTRKLKHFFRVIDTIVEISNKHIDNAIERMKNKPKSDDRERSLLERWLVVGEKTARTIAQDMFFAGIDTTANSVGKTLFMLATHPEVQDKLQAEVDAALPRIDSPLTYKTTSEIPYLKACVKETLRVSPVFLGNLRTMHEDVVLGGYRIPKGMDVIAMHGVLSKDEEQFPEPHRFIPERWTRDDSPGVRSAKDAHPFAYMPFSFGPRSCVGRRFAELEMETLIARVISQFRVEWNHGPLEINYVGINTVKTPLRFKLLDRSR